MSLMHIRLELGRTREAPEGNPRHGYEFVAPLNRYGHLDDTVLSTEKDSCTVRQFRPDREDRQGFLRRVSRGWRFDYHLESQEDDEPSFKVDRQVIAPGFYVTVTDDDGIQRPFLVAAVTRLKIQARKRLSHN